ncbi:uncharacterized protein TrAtP1_005055 [Trichoderma atroviride]|uniref:uncharacterized protein n=1 Tax=Hypocrea atroviridis TaxID=63577 RepID=UPI003332F333|nr:hypothetical protein TrAtP1_005055 [Trichoderma atroviride]
MYFVHWKLLPIYLHFVQHNDPSTDANVDFIQAQVRANYWVRTRADEPLDTVLGHNCSTSRRDRALRSGGACRVDGFPGVWDECAMGVRLCGEDGGGGGEV